MRGRALVPEPDGECAVGVVVGVEAVHPTEELPAQHRQVLHIPTHSTTHTIRQRMGALDRNTDRLVL